MTDKPYTPTTEQVRDGFRYDELAEWYDPVTPHHVINGRAFDRWLNQIEAAAEQRGAVKALRDAASSGLFVGPIADLLENRADRLGAGHD